MRIKLTEPHVDAGREISVPFAVGMRLVNAGQAEDLEPDTRVPTPLELEAERKKAEQAMQNKMEAEPKNKADGRRGTKAKKKAKACK